MTAVQQQLNLSDVRILSKPFLKEFIALYKTLPSLWNVKSRLYKNWARKDADYNVLVKKLKEIEPSANRAMVTQKINSLRSARRKEVAKIKQSIEAGGEVHEPKLWYFHLMDFLDGQEVERKRQTVKTENEEDSSPESPEPMVQIDPDIDDGEIKPPDRRQSMSSNSSESEAPSNPVVAFTTHAVPHKHAKRKRKGNDEARQQTYGAFGRYVAHKLQVLPFGQRVYLEKIINDAMFEAELGNLNRYCYVYVPPAADSEMVP